MSKYLSDSDRIIMDFSLFPFCFKGVSYKTFTNKLKDSDEFIHYFRKIFEKDIPHISQFNYNNIYSFTNGHCHNIKTNEDAYKLIIEIVKQLCVSYYNYDEKD